MERTIQIDATLRAFDDPDQVREFPHGRAEFVAVGDSLIARLVLEPGWRWSNDVKPIANTESCDVAHFQYHVSGRLGVRMDDGRELEAGPGDVTYLPPGHDAWVAGEEPVVVVDWYGVGRYAEPG
jgi:mannose-6-phosphate isomerase-like protein (cupin superfamily)